MAKRRALTELHVALTASTAKFSQKMNGVKRNMSGLEKAFMKTRKQLKKMKPAFLAVGAAATAAAVGLAALTAKSFITIDSLAKTADKLGVTTEELASLRHAANQTGVATSTLDMALQRMTRRVAEAAMGTGEAKNAIRELGLDAQELSRAGPAEAFRQIAEAVARVQSPADKLRLAFKLFDSEGAALVNTLALGSAGLDAMAEDARALGLAISRDAAARVEMANDAFDRMKKAVIGVANEIAVQLAPTITALANAITPLLTSTSGGLSESRAKLGAIGTTIAYIKDSATSIQIIGLGIKRAFVGIAQAATRLFKVMTYALRLLDKIPGLGIEIGATIDAMVSDVDAIAQGIDDTVDSMLSQKSAYNEMLQSQNRLRLEVEKEQKAREKAAEAASDQLATLKKIVTLNRDLDPILRSMRTRGGLDPMVDGPPRPEGLGVAKDEPFAGFAGPPRPDEPLRGGFAVVSSLANLATGGGSAMKSAQAKTAEGVEKLGTELGQVREALLSGRIGVMLAGVEF